MKTKAPEKFPGLCNLQAWVLELPRVGYIKIKNFCASKNTTKRVKRQPMELKKIFANLYLVKS